MIDISRLQEKRQRKLAEMEELLETAETEDRGLNEEDMSLYDKLESSVQDLDGRIDRAQRMNQRSANDAQPAARAIHEREQPEENPMLGLSEKEVNQYSLVRAIRAQAAMQRGDRRAASEAAYEFELSAEVAKRTGREPQGFFVPFDVQVRDLTVGTPTAGGNLVSTDLLAANFIDMLRNRMMVQQAGATMLTGLVGDIAIPRQTSGATAYWVAESGAPTESQQAVDQVALSPETVGAFTDYSRKLMLQSSIDVEQFVRNDLMAVLARAIDLAALHGSGTNNQPTGIAGTSGIGSVAGGTNGLAPAWSHIVDLETEVAIDNADLGRLAYMTNAKVRGKTKQTTKVASTDSVMLWQDNGFNGYPTYITNQVSSTLTKGTSSGVCSAIFFGNWADLIMAFWSGLDILVDPYTGSTSGTVRVVALQDVDIAVRHPESFSAMLDALTA